MKKRRFLAAFIWAVVFLTIAGCNGEKKIRIALSKASPNYERWLKQADSSLVLIDLYGMTPDSAAYLLAGCSGLVITGGDDVYPGWYGKEADTLVCTGFDRPRDTLEMRLIARALELNLPMLGICRGHQIINVYLNGTLIPDIPREKGLVVVHQCEDYTRCTHSVMLRHDTRLYEITGRDSGIVTTNHHQAIHLLSPVLKANVYSADGLAEGTEWMNPAGKGFLLTVQWHPERMDTANPLSGRILNAFFNECKKFRSKISHL